MRISLLTALVAAGASLLFAGAASAQGTSIPSGSYRSSCADIRAQFVSGTRLLTARCQTASGGWRNTSLRYDSCRGDIANNNGNLTCSQGGGGGGGWDRPPSGSYQQSCRNTTMRGSTLSAQCQDARGGWQYSSINVDSCRGRDISNENGRLSCSGGGGGGGRPPSGSYQQSCRDAYMNGSTLSARCQDGRGRWQTSSINVNECRGRDIANDNGRLSCSRGGGGGRPPSGSYEQSCRDAYMDGSTLSARCQDGRGRWQSSSINVNDCRGRDIANDNGRLTCSRGGGEEPVPNGSYIQTCRDASVRNGILSAACRDPSGRYQNSSISVAGCRNRDIANVNGRLSCTGGGGGGGGQVPNGSYHQTCSNAYMEGTVLRAQCRLTFGGKTKSTAIDTRICQGRDIYNLNGELMCDGRAGGR